MQAHIGPPPPAPDLPVPPSPPPPPPTPPVVDPPPIDPPVTDPGAPPPVDDPPPGTTVHRALARTMFNVWVASTRARLLRGFGDDGLAQVV